MAALLLYSDVWRVRNRGFMAAGLLRRHDLSLALASLPSSTDVSRLCRRTLPSFLLVTYSRLTFCLLSCDVYLFIWWAMMATFRRGAEGRKGGRRR